MAIWRSGNLRLNNQLYFSLTAPLNRAFTDINQQILHRMLFKEGRHQMNVKSVKLCTYNIQTSRWSKNQQSTLWISGGRTSKKDILKHFFTRVPYILRSCFVSLRCIFPHSCKYVAECREIYRKQLFSSLEGFQLSNARWETLGSPNQKKRISIWPQHFCTDAQQSY